MVMHNDCDEQILCNCVKLSSMYHFFLIEYINHNLLKKFKKQTKNTMSD